MTYRRIRLPSLNVLDKIKLLQVHLLRESEVNIDEFFDAHLVLILGETESDLNSLEDIILSQISQDTKNVYYTDKHYMPLFPGTNYGISYNQGLTHSSSAYETYMDHDPDWFILHNAEQRALLFPWYAGSVGHGILASVKNPVSLEEFDENPTGSIRKIIHKVNKSFHAHHLHELIDKKVYVLVGSGKDYQFYSIRWVAL